MSVVLWIGAGVGLFLAGMKCLSEQMRALAGKRLLRGLARATGTTGRSVLTGAAFTVVVQSSDATNCLAIELLDQGRLSLLQAAALIMGANVGTTVTGQLLALNLTDWGPLLLLPGALMRVVGGKRAALDRLGGALCGLGMLFLGMELVESGLAEAGGWAQGLMRAMSGPGAAFVCSLLLTAGLQSSTAFVGLMQTFAAAGALPMESAVWLIAGSTLGSCSTELLLGAGAKGEGRRAALFHLVFNGFGAAAALLTMRVFPVEAWLTACSPEQPARILANLNTAFRALELILMAPVLAPLVRLTERLSPCRDQKRPAVRLKEN